MNTILIFTDAATSPQTGISIGAFLCLKQQNLHEYAQDDIHILHTKLAAKIIFTEYKSKKSTWSEIKTVIDALHSIQPSPDLKIQIYTDCQTVCDLMGKRKEKLLKNNFITSTGKILQNADLYKELFSIADTFQIQTFKIKGHSSNRLTLPEKIFSVLDKLSRKKLRCILKFKALVMPAKPDMTKST